MLTQDAIAEYLDVLRDRRQSPHTVRAYSSDLGHLSAAVPTIGTADDSPALARYAASLGALPPATQRRRLSALAGFVSWAVSRGITAAEFPWTASHGRGVGWADRARQAESGAQRPASGEERSAGTAASRPEPTSAPAVEPTPAVEPAPDPVEPAPGQADIEAALRQIPRQADRDQLLFGLMARLGLRPGEALGLRVGDVDVEHELLTVSGWGGRLRRVVIDDNEVLQRLRNWLRSRPAGQSAALFPSPAGPGALRYQSMAERWTTYSARAGVQVTPGDLRRAHSAELLAGGVPEWVVRDRLGQATGPLPGARGTAASAEDAIRAWQRKRASSSGAEHRATGGQRPAQAHRPAARQPAAGGTAADGTAADGQPGTGTG